MTNAVLPQMRQRGYGRIVNIRSVVGFIPAPFMGMYTASKHAVEGYTETLDHEVRQFGVRAVLVQAARCLVVVAMQKLYERYGILSASAIASSFRSCSIRTSGSAA